MSSRYEWTCLDAAGRPCEGDALPAPVFPTQSDAETWLAESWPDLVDLGADAVVLLRDGVVVYGPMSLHGG